MSFNNFKQLYTDIGKKTAYTFAVSHGVSLAQIQLWTYSMKGKT